MAASPSRWRRRIARAFAGALGLLAVSWWLGRTLPPPARLLPALRREPLQGATQRPPFDFAYKGKRCEVRPVASYELWGLVVSHNDIHSLSDIYHDATSVDTRDLCVLWGANATRDAYRRAKFWSGPFTCYVRTPAGVDVDLRAVGNNHLIADRVEVRRALARVHRVDQVHLRGLLVDYRMEDWGDFWRRTSTVRDDAGCEVVFLEQLEVLRRHAPVAHALRAVAVAALVALPLLWLVVAWREAGRGSGSLGEL
jgi:hypothetical protein